MQKSHQQMMNPRRRLFPAGIPIPDPPFFLWIASLYVGVHWYALWVHRIVLFFGFFSIPYCLVGCLSMIVWTHAVLGDSYACVLYFCICTCSVQLSMFHMERGSRNTIIIIIGIPRSPIPGLVSSVSSFSMGYYPLVFPRFFFFFFFWKGGGGCLIPSLLSFLWPLSPPLLSLVLSSPSLS